MDILKKKNSKIKLKNDNNNDNNNNIDNDNNDENKDENFIPIEGHLICGDFNSMSKKSHYTRKQFETIRQHRERSHWEAPKFKIYKTMLQNAYIDTFWQINHHNNDNINDDNDNNEEQDNVRVGVTCWAGSRIDYIFASHDFPMQLTRSFVIDSQQATDHNAVVSIFRCL